MAEIDSSQSETSADSKCETRILVRTWPLLLVKDCGLTWKQLHNDLFPHFTRATDIANYITVRLLQLDVQPIVGDSGVRKLPKFNYGICNTLYQELRSLHPEMHTGALSRTIRRHTRLWLKMRGKVLFRRCQNVRWATKFPQPIVVGPSFTLAEVDNRWMISLSISSGSKGSLSYGTGTRHEYCFQLRLGNPGRALQSDLAILSKLRTGEWKTLEATLDKSRTGALIVRLCYECAVTPLDSRADENKVLFVSRGYPPTLVMCGIVGESAAPWIIPGTDVQSRMMSCECRRRLISQDMKREMRIPDKIRRRRQVAIERAVTMKDQFVKTWCQRAAKGIVRRAVNSGCGVIQVGRKSKYSFPWYKLEACIQHAAGQYGSHLKVIIKNNGEGEDEQDSDQAKVSDSAERQQQTT